MDLVWPLKQSRGFNSWLETEHIKIHVQNNIRTFPRAKGQRP